MSGSSSLDWNHEFWSSLRWTLEAFGISAVCFVIVAALLLRYTRWGRQFWRISGAYFTGRDSAPVWGLLALVLFQIWGTYALTLREVYRLTEDRIGLLFAINTLIIVAVEMALVTALARRDPLRVAAAGALLLCLGLGLTPLGASFAFAAFGVVVWTIGEMLAIPLTEGIVANRAGAGASGRYMGVFAATFSLAFVAAPALGTAVYERWGPGAVWAGAAAAGPLLAAGYLALAPRFRAGAA